MAQIRVLKVVLMFLLNKEMTLITIIITTLAVITKALMRVGVMSSSHFVGDRDYDPKISYWTVLKQKYMKENPDIITLDNYKK